MKLIEELFGPELSGDDLNVKLLQGAALGTLPASAADMARAMTIEQILGPQLVERLLVLAKSWGMTVTATLQAAVHYLPTRADWNVVAIKANEHRRELAALEGARPEVVGLVKTFDEWKEAMGIPVAIKVRTGGN